MHTGQRIIQLRLQKNWTQKELAKRVHINVSVMNRIESGDRPIKDSELIAIADILKVTTDYLLGRAEAPECRETKQENEFVKRIQKKNPAAEAMLRDMATLTPEEMQDVYDYLLFKKSRRKD
ncbi:helix-turn-helix domain-containing protein [Oceanobacillus sp. CFH 90083]|uniref:helix-turn-helix domain-containing protein n=1 Tax=Oceanobacillus sp. CFH 90083 TaxID=2592336 RepID=UPI00128DC264|nr:helix-turn-helix transcriptional regulator [Oceanobacillus sp. CFH 90083]